MMRRLLLLSALMLAAAPAAARDEPTPEKDLAGRTPGRPQSCIQQSQIDGSTLYRDGRILFRMKGGPDYLNQAGPGCATNALNSALISSTPSTSLCSGDIQRVVDPTTGMFYGSCGLGEFTPYARVKKPKR